MRHRSSSNNPSNFAISMGSRSQSSESFSVSEFQQNLSMLEQDWQQPLGTPSSITSSLFDVCHCCGKQDCENLEYMKKLESDTRLAAEIGQSLLLKHETFVTKSNEQRIELEKQLEESHQRLSGLEQLLDEVENQKVTISKERNKCFRENQKREKILNETLSDLEIVNEKYNQLSLELDEKTTELEKLRVFKFMVRNAELREETLTSKLDDTKQELSLCRKNELVLESKIKKLKMRYESLFNSHEQLSREIEEKMEQTLKMNTAVNPIKSVSSNSSSNHNNDTNDLISLIKELSSSNTKLKSELLSCKDQLSDARGEITALLQKLDDYETRSEQSKVTLQDDLMRKSVSCSTTLDLKKDRKKKSSITKRAASVMEKLPTTTTTKKKNKTPLQQPQQPPPPPQQQLAVSSSMPNMMGGLSSSSSSSSAIVHHHYHYYVKNSKGERVRVTDETESNSSNEFSGSDMMDCCDTSEKNDLYSAVMMDMGMQNNSREIVISPSTSSIMTIKDNNNNVQESPYVLLEGYVTQLLEKLRESDILILNRKLKRAFDMIELSRKSNNVIENILLEIETLSSRFLWIKSPLIDDVHMVGFFPLLEVVRDMLKEMGILRTTMNELQSEYVKKVQENEIRVEEEIIKKRTILMKRHQQQQQESSSLGWITSIFQKSKSTDDGYSTLTKTTTNSSTLLVQPEEEDVIKRRSNTFDKRRQIPPPPMTLSSSNGTSRVSHAIPIRTKRSLHRLHIDYEGIGPASIRHIPSDHPEWKAVNFSSSWLGGK